MLEAAVGALWSGARGWLTPPVLFVLVNLVIGTIAVMSRLMSSSSSAAGDGGGLMRAPSRLRCFSFSSRPGLPADHPAFDDGDDGTAEEAAASSSPVHPASDWGEWRRMSLLRGFSFSRRGPAADAPVTAQQPPSSDDDAEPSSLPPAQAEAAGIERSQSEAPLMRRPRARRTRTTEDPPADGHGMTVAGRHEPPAVEVDARADDFIRQFREQLRLQRLDSVLRRTGTI